MPQSKAQQATIGRVMHEATHGELKTAAGRRVRNPKQAIAIALHEAGASKFEDSQTNRRNLKRTRAKERSSETARGAAQGAARKTRAALYEEARRLGIAGRSRMNRDELAAVLH
jgi:hypothetical protein